MTTTLTRQQLVAQLSSLCFFSFLICLALFSGFADWLRSDPRYWFWLAFVIIASVALVFVFRRILNSFQPNPPAR
jgi:hypothetical protein